MTTGKTKDENPDYEACEKAFAAFAASLAKSPEQYQNAWLETDHRRCFSITSMKRASRNALKREHGTSSYNLGLSLEGIDVALLAVMASEIATRLGVKDSKSIEESMLYVLTPLINLRSHLCRPGVVLGFGLAGEGTTPETPSPLLEAVLKHARVEPRLLSQSVVWLLRNETLHCLVLADTGSVEVLVYPPPGLKS